MNTASWKSVQRIPE